VLPTAPATALAFAPCGIQHPGPMRHLQLPRLLDWLRRHLASWPLIGACGISAFPMAGRLSAKMALETDPDNYILMHAMGSNTAGQLGSVIAGGVLLAVVAGMM